MTPLDTIKSIQRLLWVADDGDFGPKSRAALDVLISLVNAPPAGAVTGLASSFADPADVVAFRRCKAQGLSDQVCFTRGDNGLGRWGADTTSPTPMCALPPEDWQHLSHPAGAKVKVMVLSSGKSVICELQDTMPRKANIKNNAVIDLNPAAAAALGLFPPFLKPCSWSWA